MDLERILHSQPQPPHSRGRTPKRPSLSTRGSAAAGSHRTTTVSSEPHQSRSTITPPSAPPPVRTLPPAPRTLPSSIPSLPSQDLPPPQLPQQQFRPVWLPLPPGMEQPSHWPFSVARQREHAEDSDWIDVEGQADDEEDAFSLEFTLGSDSSANDELFLDLPQRRYSPRSHLYQLHQRQSSSPAHTRNSHIPSNRLEPIDLTQESSSPVQSRSEPSESWRKRDRDEQQQSEANATKRQRTNYGPSSHAQHIQEIDLVNIEDDQGLAQALSKQREEQVQAQASKASEPTKLQNIQCTVCLDQPSDLTAIVCGHAFCRKCLMEWLMAGEKEHPRRSNCPACRKPIKRNAKYDTIPLEIMVRPRHKVKSAPATQSNSNSAGVAAATLAVASAV